MTEDKDIQDKSTEQSEAEAAHTANEAAEQPEGAPADGSIYTELEKIQDEAKSAQERYLRTVADMENLRKRFAREKEDIRRRAAADLIEDLLPALDNLEMGLNAAGNHPEAANVAKGFEFVAAQLSQILEQHGLAKIDPEAGAEFSHDFHEAVAHEASDAIADHHVIKVMRVGYTLNGRLLRPASVVVSSGSAE